MLNSSFYVDNLCRTSSSPEELISLYSEAVQRLVQGNFELRSCNSNCDPLKKLIFEDERIAQHVNLLMNTLTLNMEQSYIYLKIIQQHVFIREIEYLEKLNNEEIPDLVLDLNIFQDPDSILRTDGRIARPLRI